MTKLEYLANICSPLVSFKEDFEYYQEEKKCFIEQKSYEYFLNIYQSLVKVQNFIQKENLEELESVIKYYTNLLYNIVNAKYNTSNEKVLKIQFMIKGLFHIEKTLTKYISCH